MITDRTQAADVISITTQAGMSPKVANTFASLADALYQLQGGLHFQDTRDDAVRSISGYLGLLEREAEVSGLQSLASSARRLADMGRAMQPSARPRDVQQFTGILGLLLEQLELQIDAA